MEQEEEFQKLQEEYTNTVLELHHYKERVTEQEDKIAKLRVEVTRLGNAYRSLLGQQESPDAHTPQIVDAEVVPETI